MYIFVTYGYLGMRGVQVKALRLANFLESKGQKVKFYDHGDHKPLLESKVDFENWDLNNLYHPEDIIFPKRTQAVIFTDLPTNKVGQLAIFIAAKSQGIPVVIIDNFYKEVQLKQKVFLNLINYSDLFILNGLFLPQSKLPPQLKILGPFIRTPQSPEEIWRWAETLGVKKGQKVILGTGYAKDILKLLEKLGKGIDDPNIVILALGATTKIKRIKNIIYLPFLNDLEINNLLRIADLAIYKLGFVQVIEAWIAKVPVIVTGEMKGFFTDWLDPKLQGLLIEAPNIKQLQTMTKDIINRGKKYQQFKSQINKIKFAPQNALEITSQLLKNIKSRKVNIKKTVIVSLGDKKSLKKLKQILQKNPFVYPMIFDFPCLRPDQEKNNKLIVCDFEPSDSEDILKWGFQAVYRLTSCHSFHAGATIIPHFLDMMNDTARILDRADKIIYCDQKVADFIKPLLKRKR